MSQIKKAAFMSLTLGIATIATTLGPAKQASALPLLDVLASPLNAVMGRPQTPPLPMRSTDLQLMNGNLNGNNLTLCTLTCGLPGLPGSNALRPAGFAPTGVPAGFPPSGPGGPVGAPMGVPAGFRPSAPAPTASRPGPSLLLPPIPLPNPFN